MAVQYETSQFNYLYIYDHAWIVQLYVIYCPQIVTLSGDQNEVFESL